MADTRIIGITGGVGAGKSTVLNYIKEHYKCLVIYADDVGNEVKKKGCPSYDELVYLLGKEILSSDGEIDKKKMAEAIFGDEARLQKVNNILHPAVNAYIINIIDSERLKGELDFVFVEAALLIENGYESIVDELWYIYADEEVRRKRLKESRGYTDSKIESIFKSQLSDEEFRRHSDFIIDNSGSILDAADQIDKKLGDWRK